MESNQILHLFAWLFSSHLRMFRSYGDITISDEGLQILTYARLLCYAIDIDFIYNHSQCYLYDIQVYQ